MQAAEAALALLTADVPQTCGRDRRIEQAIAWVQQHLHHKITLPDVAAQVHLSPERTRHLFVQEAGGSFSQFLMWKRIKTAIALTALAALLCLAPAAQAQEAPRLKGRETAPINQGCGFVPGIMQAMGEYDLVALKDGRFYFGDRAGDLTKARPATLTSYPLVRQ